MTREVDAGMEGITAGEGIDPRAEAPELAFVAQSPFTAVSLARDAGRFWTNDFKADQIVAFHIPE